MDIAALKSLIVETPECWIDGALRNSSEVLDALNRIDSARIRPVPMGTTPVLDVLNYLNGCASGPIALLLDIESDRTKPSQIRSAARFFNLMSQNLDRFYDMDTPKFRLAIAAFMSLGVITQAEVDGLYAIIPTQAVSLAQDRLGEPVTDAHLEAIAWQI